MIREQTWLSVEFSSYSTPALSDVTVLNKPQHVLLQDILLFPMKQGNIPVTKFLKILDKILNSPLKSSNGCGFVHNYYSNGPNNSLFLLKWQGNLVW